MKNFECPKSEREWLELKASFLETGYPEWMGSTSAYHNNWKTPICFFNPDLIEILIQLNKRITYLEDKIKELFDAQSIQYIPENMEDGQNRPFFAITLGEIDKVNL